MPGPKRKRGEKQSSVRSVGQTSVEAAPAHVQPVAAPRRLAVGHVGLWLGLASVCGFYLLLKMFGLNPYAGDEHIYLYQSKLVSQGLRPYADFAMAHPPLQTLIHALLLKVFGFGFLPGRLLPVGWCLAAGLLLAFVVRRELGVIAAITATGLFLLSYEVLRSSTHATGVNATMTFILAALLSHRRGWVVATAALCTAAVLTRFYAAPAILAFVAHGLVRDPPKGGRLVGYGAAFGAASFTALGLWTGFGAMWSNLFLYHANKTAMGEDTLANMRDTVLFHNATLAAAFGVGAIVALVSFLLAVSLDKGALLPRLRRAAGTSRTGLPLLSTFVVAIYVVLLSRMDRVWMYYFVPAFPFAAIVAGAWVSRCCLSAFRLFSERFSLEKAGLSRAALFGLAASFIVFALLVFVSPRLEQRLDYWQGEMGRPEAERVKTYAWRDGVLPRRLNDFVREWLWQDQRVVGDRYFSWNYLLWHESRVLDITEEAVAAVRANTTQQGEIFGDSGTVPLLALLSGRKIAANEADTNIQRYRSGLADPVALVRAIDLPSTELIVLRPRFGVAGLEQIQDLVRNKYERVKVLKSSQGMALVFFKRRSSDR
ncbi:MAG: glycosyltransferase family 39 protein [Myxococcota bacterium]|nr:glycosyltransferase family 39 protein [Myxococcota bacterium]